ncbi:hypothetical protein V3W47_06545 [Deinococcus sp. YIM 134068]|uniref:hypothetical protein n=1 Tax=Deinococcus lichenicola TaxID=3118910 RepID=UPI002F950740
MRTRRRSRSVLTFLSALVLLALFLSADRWVEVGLIFALGWPLLIALNVWERRRNGALVGSNGGWRSSGPVWFGSSSSGDVGSGCSSGSSGGGESGGCDGGGGSGGGE